MVYLTTIFIDSWMSIIMFYWRNFIFVIFIGSLGVNPVIIILMNKSFSPLQKWIDTIVVPLQLVALRSQIAFYVPVTFRCENNNVMFRLQNICKGCFCEAANVALCGRQRTWWCYIRTYRLMSSDFCIIALRSAFTLNFRKQYSVMYSSHSLWCKFT